MWRRFHIMTSSFDLPFQCCAVPPVCRPTGCERMSTNSFLCRQSIKAKPNTSSANISYCLGDNADWDINLWNITYWYFFVNCFKIWKHSTPPLSNIPLFMMTSSNRNISALLVLCEGNPPVTGGFSKKRPVTRSVDVSFDLRLNKRLSKKSGRRWFDTPLRSLWRHCNVNIVPWSRLADE